MKKILKILAVILIILFIGYVAFRGGMIIANKLFY